MNILLVSDAWKPQVNGVVRTLETTREELQRAGHTVHVLSPAGGRTLPCPGYPEIRLALRPAAITRRLFDACDFDAIHIATEGPLGLAARRWCLRRGLAFTTSYHTRFPEYLRLRAPVPLALSYRYLRWFHGAAARTLVRTETQRGLLTGHGFENLEVWPGGVDTQLFHPRDKDYLCLPRPVAMYMGRIAREKNIEAFLDLALPGSKVVIGGGPAADGLRRKYPDVHFLGYRHGEELARCLAAADVFVFPSLTDTLGLVMLEAMACGVPVAAFPVPGPRDVIIDGSNGALDTDLRQAVFRALALDPVACIDYAADHSWRRCSQRFLSLLVRARGRNDSPAESSCPYNPEAWSTPLPPAPTYTRPPN